MNLKHILFFSAFSVLLFSCVSSKKFKAAQAKIDSLTAANAKLAGDLKNCNDLTAQDANQRAALQNQLDALNKQVDFLKQKSRCHPQAIAGSLGHLQLSGRKHQKIAGQYWRERQLYSESSK